MSRPSSLNAHSTVIKARDRGELAKRARFENAERNVTAIEMVALIGREIYYNTRTVLLYSVANKLSALSGISAEWSFLSLGTWLPSEIFDRIRPVSRRSRRKDRTFSSLSLRPLSDDIYWKFIVLLLYETLSAHALAHPRSPLSVDTCQALE